MEIIVRNADGIVFRVDSETLEPVSHPFYDASCFSQPKKGVWYMSYSEWCSVMGVPFLPNTRAFFN